jgi:hypothetical protein
VGCGTAGEDVEVQVGGTLGREVQQVAVSITTTSCRAPGNRLPRAGSVQARIAGPLLSSAGRGGGGSLAKGGAVAGGRTAGVRGSGSESGAETQKRPVRLRRWRRGGGGAPGPPRAGWAGGLRLGAPAAPVVPGLQRGQSCRWRPRGHSRAQLRRPRFLRSRPPGRRPRRGGRPRAEPPRGRHASGAGGVPRSRRSCRKRTPALPGTQGPPQGRRRAAVRVQARASPGARGGAGGDGRWCARCWGRGPLPGGPPRQGAADQLWRPRRRRQLGRRPQGAPP